MIVVKEFPDKEFATKEELFKALRENNLPYSSKENDY
jgi:hypothetical protein